MTTTSTAPHCHIAMIGLGVMGKSLTLNLIDNGFHVAGFDLNSSNIQQTTQEAQIISKGQFVACDSLEQILAHLPSPRVIALSVPAGDIVDSVITDLLNAGLNPQDIVIDTGNSLWTDTIARDKHYQGKLNFFSTAVSGGEQGARFGPALMASGDEHAWEYVKPMWNAIAAKVNQHGLPVEPLQDGEACATFTGPSGSGHYVKMVHNGIEYADMQLICEVYQYLHQVIGLKAEHIGDIFSEWNQGVLNSYLMEISADILKQKDFQSDQPLVEMILDKAGQKGTGVWTAINSLEVGCPAPSIAQSVYARSLSSLKERRQLGEQKLAVITETHKTEALSTTIAELHDALYCAKLCVYAQGFDLMKTTSEQQDWQLNFAEIAKGWRAGCIIRAVFLQSITKAFEADPQLDNLLFDQHFGHEIKSRQLNWRRCVANASLYGVAIPGIGSALSYFDSMRCATLPANLLQAQRDYFGSHTYSRIDQPESQKYHVEWSHHPRTEIKK
ncbi:NADP-dependent phosphogluconate dehydrogenase [Vibrio rumoiensis]|uniref:6-phosphogluconate dehydrogenase, decarboxylating n=1 Tax=Vibrio rumoiensis 1S-45 TaxID=1188252 RepID=A0A1E5E3X4_9VIBR|nr:NADP-dependent phosphogluconate dehydrogenase [Vibrio rumoiensis]OEF27284.1 phosphogluconate dehydrogenase (NADP(+)-dependent, decarboxylating) [Vibrio rumoiensis 1S-45]